MGVFLIVVSAFYVSSFLVFLGVGLFFWGTILLYITPTRHVPIKMFNAEAEVAAINIERIITEFGTTFSGIYLPPRNLKNAESSLVLIPTNTKFGVPSPEEITDTLFTTKRDGVLITPPGMALCRLFEQKLGTPFTKMALNQLTTISKLLEEELELVENIEFNIKGNLVIVEITGSIFDEICLRTDSQPKTHKQIGCLLSSAIACALTKVVGKPVTIKNEIRNQKTKTKHIEYKILEG